MRTRTTTKTSVRGGRGRGRRAILLPALLGLALAGWSTMTGAAAQSGKKKQAASHAVIAGTVFRDPGLAQAGAAVTLVLKDDPKGKKLQEATSDNRGEFAFRVPPGPAVYVVHAALKGYRATQMEIEISGEEQVNATLLLVPESK
jgi:hypothetical protein